MSPVVRTPHTPTPIACSTPIKQVLTSHVPCEQFIGVCGGLIGAVFNSVNARITKWRIRTVHPSPVRRWLEVMCITATMASLAFCVPLLGSCKEKPPVLVRGKVYVCGCAAVYYVTTCVVYRYVCEGRLGGQGGMMCLRRVAYTEWVDWFMVNL